MLKKIIPAALSLLVLLSAGCKKQEVPRPEIETPLPSLTPAVEATAEPDMPETAAVPEGIWHCNTNTCQLRVYPNGGYHMEYGSDTIDGYLEQEESSASWRMMKEDGTQWMNNARLLKDSSDIDTLTLTIGLGAERLLAGEIEQKQEAAYSPVSVRPFDPENDRLELIDLSSGDNPADIVFTAEEPLVNFRILFLTVEGFDSEGNMGFVTSELFSREEVKQGEQFAIKADFFGTMPNLGFCYDDETGMPHYRYITLSGYDGSLEITPFWEH